MAKAQSPRAAKLPKSMTTKRPRSADSEDVQAAVSKAAQVAAALVEQREAAVARKAAKLAKAAEDAATEDGKNPTTPNEAQTTENLNAACAKAKAAHKAAPQDEALKAAYESAKAAFREFQSAKVVEATEQWTCAICNVTFPLRPGAKEAHLAGKQHRRKAKAAELSTAQSATEQAAVGFFECKLCGCTGALAAKEAHDSGSKHKARLEEVAKIWSKSAMKKGDWICVKHGLFVQLNFASKDVCRRATCDGTKEEGLPFEDVRDLIQQSNRSRRDARVEAMAPVKVGDADIELKCKDCGGTYSFVIREQKHYEEKGFAKPSRCLKCRKKKRAAAPAASSQG